MRKKLLWIAVLGLSGSASLQAQQDPSYTHFIYNKLMYNPAYAGASNQFCLNAVTHQQYVGYEDQTKLLKTQGGMPISSELPQNIAPKTSGAAFSAPIALTIGGAKINVGGVFASFIKDQVAYEDNTYIRGGLSAAYTTSDGVSYRLGFEANSLTKKLDGEGLRYHDPNDPNIPTGVTGETKMAFGAGFYYQNPNIFNGLFAGLSMTNMMPQTYAYGNGGAIKITTARHIYLVAGYKQEQFLANPLLTFEPSMLIKTVVGDAGGLVKPELDLQGMVTYNDMFAGGLNLRSYIAGMDAVSFMLGYYPPLLGGNGGASSRQRLRVGYAYDLVVSNIRTTSYGTHELQVNYCFTFELPSRPPRIYRHPRWMNRSPKTD